MAIVIQQQPERYNLAYNDNAYTFFYTGYTPTQRFKISVVTPALELVGQFRVYPRIGIQPSGNVQENKAYFDPSRILQTQLLTNVATPDTGHNTYFNAPTLSFDYALAIQAEDKNAQGVYEVLETRYTDVKTVWNGGVTKIDWLTFNYTDYDYSVGTANSYLTDAPTTQYVNVGDSAFVYFLDSSRASTTLTLEAFTNGSSDGTATLTFSMDADFGYFAIGYGDIRIASTSNWSTDPYALIENADYYTITLANGETHTYYIGARCSKYTPIRLHWLNRLGGYDSFNFSLKSMEETQIDRKSYHQEHHRFTGTAWEYDASDRGMTDYHVGMQDKLTVNTPFLTEQESVWMRDFATSPVIYQQVGGRFIAMSGKPKMISKQTSLNDKLMQYTFELDYSLNDMRQRG